MTKGERTLIIWDRDELLNHFVGKSIVSADIDTGMMVLSDGTTLEFEKEAFDCCSWIELTSLRTTPNIITAASIEDDETDGTGPYRAWLHVVTEAGELNVAEARGDASNGYYLHGFALAVTVGPKDAGPKVQYR